MHTFEIYNWSIHYNSDLSGDVEFNQPSKETIKIHGEVIRAFAAHILGQEALSVIEEALDDWV